MTKGKGNHDKEQYIINVMGIKLTGEALIIEKQILTNNIAKKNTFCIQTKLIIFLEQLVLFETHFSFSTAQKLYGSVV